MTLLRSSVFVAVAVAVAVPPALSAGVRADRDRRADFASIEAWSWRDAAEKRRGGRLALFPLAAQTIEESLTQQLTANGFRFTAAADAQVLVAYGVEMETKELISRNTSASFADPFYGTNSDGGFQRDMRLQSYQQGSVVIELVDKESGATVYKGWLTSVVDPKKATEENSQIKDGMKRLFETFPPKRPDDRPKEPAAEPAARGSQPERR